MIIYFSGTGNSYSVANELAAALNDRAVPLIRLQNQKAVTGSRCAYCMACVHACPHGGMLVNGHKIKKENQYRHPEVEMKDLFLR